MSLLYSLHCSRVSFTVWKHMWFSVYFYKIFFNQSNHVISFPGVNGLSSGPWILVEDLSSVYSDVEVERGAVKHSHKKRKLNDGREKTMVRTDHRSHSCFHTANKIVGSDTFVHVFCPYSMFRLWYMIMAYSHHWLLFFVYLLF